MLLIIKLSLQQISFDIQLSLVNSKIALSKTWNNVGTLILKGLDSARKDGSLTIDSQKDQLIFIDQNEIDDMLCKQDCYYLIKYLPNNDGQKTYTNYIRLDQLQNKQQYTEFIEVHLNSNEQIIALNYGIKENEKKDLEDMPFVQIVEAINSLPQDLPIEETIINPNEKKIEEQQPFYKKYFWWIVIGIVAMFLMNGGVDKDKLEQQQQQQPQR